MKKEVNVFRVFLIIVSILILILSFFGCIENRTSSLISDPTVKQLSLVSVSVAPTVIGMVLFFFRNRVSNVFGCIVLFLQAVWVSVFPALNNMVSDLMPGIAGVRSFCRFTGIGIAVCVLCWVAFVLSVILTVGQKTIREIRPESKKKRYFPIILLIVFIVIMLLLIIFKDVIIDYIYNVLY